MLHITCGGQNAESRNFLDDALKTGVEFDVIGESYYPRWHGTLEDLRNNLTDLAGRYRKEIIIVEYSAPNVRQINDIVRGVPNGQGMGTFIWEPTSGALFDREGNTKPEIDTYVEIAGDHAGK